MAVSPMVHLRNELRFIPGQGENASQTGMNLRWKEALDLPERSGTPFPGVFMGKIREWRKFMDSAPILCYYKKRTIGRCFGRDAFLNRAL